MPRWADRTSHKHCAAGFSRRREFQAADPHPPRPSRQGRRAGQRLLAVCRHDRERLLPASGSPLRRRCSATRRERFFGLRRGLVVGGLKSTSNVAGAGDREHTKRAVAQIAIGRASLSRPLPRADILRQADLVGRAPARFDRLQNQLKIE